MNIKYFLISMLFNVINGQTLAPTTNVSIPGIATLRPTVPTLAPVMLPPANRETDENKTEEMPIVAVYFIMLGLALFITFIGVGVGIIVALFPSLAERQRREESEKIELDDEW